LLCTIKFLATWNGRGNQVIGWIPGLIALAKPQSISDQFGCAAVEMECNSGELPTPFIDLGIFVAGCIQ
jgi:hypothetical protein